jgi:DNA topoisomerase-6 subunit B
MFLRRRERAKSEFRRRNIFELYIEEVVEACGRLKGGKLPKEKLKAQLQKIALKRTGGTRTDAILGHEGGPEGLPHSIIVTPDGPEGAAAELPGAEPAAGAPAAEEPRPGKAKAAAARGKAAAARGKAKGKTRPARATRPARPKPKAKALKRRKR